MNCEPAWMLVVGETPLRSQGFTNIAVCDTLSIPNIYSDGSFVYNPRGDHFILRRTGD